MGQLGTGGARTAVTLGRSRGEGRYWSDKKKHLAKPASSSLEGEEERESRRAGGEGRTEPEGGAGGEV